MGYSEFIAIVNATAILMLLLMFMLLLITTKFRGENAYAAAIIVLTTIPTYSYNLCRSEGWYDIAQWFAPFSFSVNTMLMPLLWLFTYRNFNPDFKFKPTRLLHFLPAVACLVLYLSYIFSLPSAQRFNFMIHENTGSDNWLGNVNAAIVFVQMFVYFVLIFVYLYRTKRVIGENFSQSEWLYKLWIPKFMMLFAGLFIVVFICYVLWPRTDAWLIQILNVIAMSYLVFHAMKAAEATQNQLLSVKVNKKEPGVSNNRLMDTEQLQIAANAVLEYLQTSEVYLNPNITLQDVAIAISISPKRLSTAINTVLHKNFFELINQSRIEKSKIMLRDYKKKNLTLDSIALECGFNSRYTFSNAFKKLLGVSTKEWLNADK